MALFGELGSNFTEITNKWFNWTYQVDPVVAAAQLSKDSDTINKHLFNKFFEIRETKQGIIEDIDSIKDFYFSQMIIGRILDDALNPTGNESKLFKVNILDTDKNVDESSTKIVDDFIDEFNLQKIIVDVANDLLTYGEYFLGVTVNGFDSDEGLVKGVVNIHDDVDSTLNLPIFRDSDVSYILSLEDKKIKTKQPSEIIYFSMPSSRIKVKVDGIDDKVLYLRMGKSVLYPIFGILKELKFLETLVPLGFINDAMATKLVSVNVPSTTKPSDALNIAQSFERMINKSLQVKTNGKTDDEIISTISSRVGEVKVIPNFGDKGDLQAEDFNSENKYEDMDEKIKDIRKMALITIGIPPGIIDEEGMKSDVIKDHIRYTKKLKSIQFALKEGLQRLIMVHLTNNGFTNYVKEDVQVQFLNILNTDDLEKLEFIDLTVSMLDNFKSFVVDFEDREDVKINNEEYFKFLNSQFSTITGFNIFEYQGGKEGEEKDEY